jgi:hypothetical protein
LGSGRWLLAAGGSERQPGSCEPGQKQKKRYAGKKSTHAYFTSHSKRKVFGESHDLWLAEITAHVLVEDTGVPERDTVM